MALARWPAWARYVAAVALTVAVVAGRLALDPWWGQHQNRHLVFLPTAMLAAWLGGFGPGVLSSVLCTLAIDYFWTDPRHVLLHPSFELILFLLVAVAMARLIESLHRARARADAARDSREQVLAIVAHDLRSPLTTIKASTTLIRRKATEPDQVLHKLAIIDRAVDRSDKLIRDLVDATRAEHGELEVTPQEEDVGTIVQEITDSFRPVARDKKIQFDTSEEGEGAIVRCDRDRLLQVLGNLLSNALKFTPENGHIALVVTAEANSVSFEVSDSGPGISAEHLPHIFDRYWYADRRGTGLGLFIAQSIVRAHGSKLRVESHPGHGATFRFSLARSPRLASTAQRRAEPASSGVDAPTSPPADRATAAGRH